MEQILTVGGYVLACLFVVLMIARWVLRHDPVWRDTERQEQAADRDRAGEP